MKVANRNRISNRDKFCTSYYGRPDGVLGTMEAS